MSNIQNRAAYLTGPKVRPLVVQDAPYTAPSSDQIVVKNGAIALNPLEQIKQDVGNFIYDWMKYPFVMGADVAGTVVEVGSAVTRFQVGDRVLGYATGMEKVHNTSAMSGFQLYTVLQDKLATPIPESLEFEKAAVVPLGLSTASCGLYEKDQLALRYPTVDIKEGEGREVVIIWGGSTSVGCNAIQLATASGYEVITTCSQKNFGLVKSLGATAAFDYRSPTVIKDILGACQGRKVAGAMSIGPGGAERCIEILGKSEGNRFLSMVSYPTPQDPDAGTLARIGVFASFSARMVFKKGANGVRSKYVWGANTEYTEVGKAVFEDYLPQALAQGKFTCAPDPKIIGNQLDAIQSGLDMLKKGAVSANKLVVKF